MYFGTLSRAGTCVSQFHFSRFRSFAFSQFTIGFRSFKQQMDFVFTFIFCASIRSNYLHSPLFLVQNTNKHLVLVRIEIDGLDHLLATENLMVS
jgi:hypothetical protein